MKLWRTILAVMTAVLGVVAWRLNRRRSGGPLGVEAADDAARRSGEVAELRVSAAEVAARSHVHEADARAAQEVSNAGSGGVTLGGYLRAHTRRRNGR